MRSESQTFGGNTDFGLAMIDAEVPMPEGIIGPDGNPAPKRFNVYRNNVVVSLTEALAQTFPAIERLVGEDYFKALARVFVAEHPPSSPVLIWYGDAFPDFIEAFPPLEGYPYLADVARLEWFWLQAYHAEDIAPLDPQLLAQVPSEAVGDVRFDIHPAAAVIDSEWPVLSLALANRFAVDDASRVELQEAEPVLITRPDLEVRLHLMRPGAARFFEELSGATLQDAAALAAAEHPEFDLSACLSDLLAAGAFSGLQIDDRSGLEECRGACIGGRV